MRERVFQLYKKLLSNTTNKIVFFSQKERQEKTFREFVIDVDQTILKLKKLEEEQPMKRVGILGNTSYWWMVLDHACIKGGYESVALPESFSRNSLHKIITDLKVDLILIDFDFQDKIAEGSSRLVYFNTPPNYSRQDYLIELEEMNGFSLNENIIRENYSIVFSSGTSENIKYIKRKFQKIKPQKISFYQRLRAYHGFRNSIGSILKKKGNKIIVFLPFSHPMQRDFIRISLFNRCDILLSSPNDCIKHIMTEKPNIMVSIPPVYDVLAILIEARIKKFSQYQQRLFKLFLLLNLNKRNDKNIFKKWFSKRLFQNIKKIYGERADLFITGSAPAKKSTLETFYKIGVRVYEAYGQSELSTTIMNNPNNFRIGSVGRIKKGQVRIGDNSEVLVRFSETIDTSNENILNIEDGFIRTGDTGYLDKDGYLFLTGRLDDVLVLGKGKKVHPQSIESHIINVTKAKYATVFTKNNHDISAYVFSKNLTTSSLKELLIKSNEQLGEHESIRYFYLVKEEPSQENGLMTSTMKLKRKRVLERYGESAMEKV